MITQDMKDLRRSISGGATVLTNHSERPVLWRRLAMMLGVPTMGFSTPAPRLTHQEPDPTDRSPAPRM